MTLPRTFNLWGDGITPPVMLAPMAGISDSAFRQTCLQFGCPLVFTEVVSAAGLVYQKTGRTLYLLECAPGEQPVVAHIYGSDPQIMAEAASRIEQLGRFVGIDINCGCPVRRITARGAGVALMRDPELIGDIVRAVRAAVSFPVTVKTRLGLTPDARLVDEVSQAVEEAGGDAVIIHARYASVHHQGPADWGALADIKSARGIPVIGNGGIEAPSDAGRMLRETGVDAVMIGRHAWGRPWFFRQVLDSLAGDTPRPEPLWGERRATMEAHFDRLLALREREVLFRTSTPRPARESASLAFRPQLHKYLAGTPVAGFVRRSLNGITSPESLHAILEKAGEACT